MMKPRIRVILESAIDEGVRHGYRRAFKHTNEPPESSVVESILDEVMAAIDSYFTFDDNNFQG